MKLYKNISRFQFRRLYPKGSKDEKKLLWAIGLKSGDVVAVCSGWNVRIAKVIPERSSIYQPNKSGSRPQRDREGWAIMDVQVWDDEGGFHYTSSCCWPAETVEQVRAPWLQDFSQYPNYKESSKQKAIREAVLRGEPITDTFGVKLPWVRDFPKEAVSSI